MPTRQTIIRRRYLEALESQGYVECGICGQRIEKAEELTVDHIIPKISGGSNRVRNFQPAHFSCNQEKGMRENFKLERKKTVEPDTIRSGS